VRLELRALAQRRKVEPFPVGGSAADGSTHSADKAAAACLPCHAASTRSVGGAYVAQLPRSENIERPKDSRANSDTTCSLFALRAHVLQETWTNPWTAMSSNPYTHARAGSDAVAENRTKWG
jgi:hypothetical protein